MSPRDVGKKESRLTRVSKFERHADDDVVRSGQVRELDRVGSDKADEAADHGMRSVSERVIEARRHLSGVYST